MARRIHRFFLAFLGPIWRMLSLLKVEGRDRLPETGYVMGFNHPGILEIFHVVFGHRKPMFMMGKEEAFRIPIVGHILREWGGQIPLKRGGGGNNQARLQEAVDRLHESYPVAMAPEGTNNKFGPLGRGRSGAARLALAAGVPLVPVAVHRSKRFPRRRPRVVFGEPMDVSAWYGQNQDPEIVREVTDDFMGRLAGMLGEDYDPAKAPDYAARKGFRAS